MRNRWLSFGAGVALVLSAAPASANTTGAVMGFVTESDGKPVAGALVEATSISLMGKQTAITKIDGSYRFPLLHIGMYNIIARRDGLRDAEQKDVDVQIERTIRVDLSMAPQEVKAGDVIVTAKAPVVDMVSQTKGVVLKTELLSNLALDRQLTRVLGLTPGASSDATGVNFSGATGLENSWIIDGTNTTDLLDGGPSTNAPLQFIQQIEVKTGGYNAEFGRANGAVVNVVTKSGGNEFHGSAWFNFENQYLRNDPQVLKSLASAVGSENIEDYWLDLGFTVGGYVIRDRVWFFVGFSPTFERDTRYQIFSMRIDDGSGVPTTTDQDVNHDGKPDDLYVEVARRHFNWWRTRVQPLLKLTVNVTDEHSLEVSYIGSIIRDEGIYRVNAAPSAMFGKFLRDNSDYGFKWTSQLLNKTMLAEVKLGYHREQTGSWPISAAGNQPLVVQQYTQMHPEFLDLHDPSTPFVEMPVTNYAAGGWGYFENNRGYRTQGSLTFTNFATLLGNHQIMYGADFEKNDLWNLHGYTGGYYLQDPSATSPTYTATWLLSTNPEPDPATGKPADPLWEQHPYSDSKVRSFYHAYFVRDQWNPMQNLTLNLGMRFERQEVRSARNVLKIGTGKLDQFNNGWAPRIGTSYDWTNKGKSKLHAFYGRFYEEIPMDINNRAFGNEVTGTNAFSTTMGFPRNSYGYMDPWSKIIASTESLVQKETMVYRDASTRAYNPATGLYDGEATGPIWDPHNPNAPSNIEAIWSGRTAIKGQYHEEFAFGYEHEVLPDLSVGLTWSRKYLSRVVEDVSTDGGTTYFIANPGFGFGRTAFQAEPYLASNKPGGTPWNWAYRDFEFPRPQRNYNSLEFVVRKNMSNNWQMLFSYVYSHTYGNYPGLYTANNGQVDPNLSSQYDLPSLLINRMGDLDSDIRHSIKLDGSYEKEIGKWGSIVAGPTIRFRTGTPREALGRENYYGYGPDEIFMVPRATVGRNPAVWGFDMMIKYKYKMAGGRAVSFRIDIFNVFNNRQATALNDRYTYSSVTTLVSDWNPNGIRPNGKQWSLDKIKAHTIPDWVYDMNSIGPTYCNPPVPGGSITCSDTLGNSATFTRYDPVTDNGYLLSDSGTWVYRWKGFGEPTTYQDPRTVRIGLEYEF